ncbi:Nuclear transport factor 2 (NTF2) family protein with RNA binding (RRM-RBD-RNP motifs) domain [Raphanus sativus]|uniref:Nuclear transport factor 2 n=1 Tax=Raphanus sativus TaxID=3726 RepID=A0A6J0L862_RAPSA|nr:nuclear transport factor 2 [Raphanus sativus]KAJ4874635.1 Nuclear transport factor 2 (NTF2) family protein with RNA binding (RRM-RBD-RNP motifs) domain [Raphanus sativus]
MAAAEEGGAVVHSAPHEVLSEAFVEQYYYIMGSATHEAHRLYVDGSVVTRPGGPDGTMLSFTSLEAIKEHYLTSEYKGNTYDVLSVDSQRSLQDGIIIMVVGFLTGGDNLKRKFSQTFYLAPQDKAHVVVNDMYRFVDEQESSPPTLVESEVAKPVDVISKTELVHMVDAPAKKSVNTAEVKKVVAAEATPPPPVTAQKPKEPIAETAAAAAAADGAKKSYAAMVQSMLRNAAPFQVKAAPAVQKPKTMAPSKGRAAPAPAASAVGKPEKKSDQRIVDEPGTSVFVSNLPMDAKAPQLYELFKAFGPIKEGGVQIRSSRASGRCFGFVSFESVASVQSMLKAAKSNPFKLGEHKLRVKEKQVEYDGSKQSGGRSGGGGSKAQNGSVEDSKTPTGSVVEESKTPTGSADGSKSENGSSAGGGEDDDGFKTIRNRKNRNKKNSEVAPKVKA